MAGDYPHPDRIGRDTFYGWLATEGRVHIRTRILDDFYVLDKARKSVPPSQMMRMVWLPWYDNASDEDVRSPWRLPHDVRRQKWPFLARPRGTLRVHQAMVKGFVPIHGGFAREQAEGTATAIPPHHLRTFGISENLDGPRGHRLDIAHFA